MMNTPHSLPDNLIPVSESGSLDNDWNLTEENIINDSTLFDGKIIARMPDLGSNGIGANDFVKNIESPKFPAVLKRTYQSITSLASRQQFFQRMTAFGGVVLLCGVGILFLEHSNNDEHEGNINDIVKTLPETDPTSFAHSEKSASNDSAWSPVILPESTVLSDSGTVIPVADIAAVQKSVAQSSEKADSPWNRPTANSYSPWNVPPKQSERVSAPSVSAVVDSPAAPSPPPQIATVEMTPMTPLSMPVSPYEQQLFVAQSAPPVRSPVDPFIQSNVQPNAQSGNSLVPGMVQTHERLENAVNTIPQSGAAQPMPTPPRYQQYQSPQYQPLVPAQERVPMNTMPPGYSSSQHGQYGQYNQYAGVANTASPNVPVQNVPPQNMPIPSGVSTLQPQAGYYSQPVGNAATPNSNFHPNVTPAYRRVY